MCITYITSDIGGIDHTLIYCTSWTIASGNVPVSCLPPVAARRLFVVNVTHTESCSCATRKLGADRFSLFKALGSRPELRRRLFDHRSLRSLAKVTEHRVRAGSVRTSLRHTELSRHDRALRTLDTCRSPGRQYGLTWFRGGLVT